MNNNLTNNTVALQALLTSVQALASSGGPVTSVNGKTGDVKLELSDLGLSSKELTFKDSTGTVITKQLVTGPLKPLISFTIEGTAYQAEDGMTWGEWVESKYNIDGYSVLYKGDEMNERICPSEESSSWAIVYNAGDLLQCYSNDIIEADHPYALGRVGWWG